MHDFVRGYASGTAGTAAMTLTTWLQGRVRADRDIPVDYDATSHVVTAASRVLRVEPDSDRAATALFVAAHWGYGSGMALGHRLLRRRLSPPRAAATFFVGCQAMAMVLLPVLGDTPPPWRWRRDVLVSSLVHHAVYAATVAAADRALAPAGERR